MISFTIFSLTIVACSYS